MKPTHVVHQRLDRRSLREGVMETVISQTVWPTAVATLAVEIAKQLAFIYAVPDGEDSAGRSRARAATPEEVAQRACDIAEQMWTGFEQRGWLIDLPTPDAEKE